jgi:sialidase-1
MKTTLFRLIASIIAMPACTSLALPPDANPTVRIEQPRIPVLTRKANNPVLKITLHGKGAESHVLRQVRISLEGSTDINGIESVSLFHTNDKGGFSSRKQFGETATPAKEILLRMISLYKPTH